MDDVTTTYLPPPRPDDEPRRQRATEALGLVGVTGDQSLDDLVHLASVLCGASIAVVGLMDNDRQWFQACCGFDAGEAPRDSTLCAHTMLADDILVIPDARADARYANNPFVQGEPFVRFYAGVTLTGQDGTRYGTLCVADPQPRVLDHSQRDALKRLGRQAVAHLEMRRDRRIARQAEASLARLLDAMPDGFVSCGPDGRLLLFNGVARQWHGVDPTSLPPEEWASHFDLYSADGVTLLPTAQVPLLRAFNGETVRDAEIVVRAKGQPPRPVLCNAERLVSPEGGLMGAVCVMRDVTALRAASARVEEEQQRLRVITDNAPALITYIDTEERYRFANAAFGEWYGVAPESVIGRTIAEVRGEGVRDRMRPVLQRVLAGEQVSMETEVQHATLGLRHCQMTLIPDRSPTGVRGYHVMAYDVTAQRHIARMLEKQALEDDLTGLPNRAAWTMELDRALARGTRHGNPVGVMYLDLDGFKSINDRYGHAAGDAVLKAFARAMRAGVRKEDYVARLSGDEFVILVDPVPDMECAVASIATQLRRACEPGIEFEGHRLPINPSIGAAIDLGTEYSADLLMREADAAMYAAKRSGARQVEVRCLRAMARVASG